MPRPEVDNSRRGFEAAIFEIVRLAPETQWCDVFCREQSRLSNFSASLSFRQ
jgi:hypothetical protein